MRERSSEILINWIIKGRGTGWKKNKDIRHFRDLLVYRRAFEAAMTIFQLTKEFPSEERYSMENKAEKFCF